MVKAFDLFELIRDEDKLVIYYLPKDNETSSCFFVQKMLVDEGCISCILYLKDDSFISF